MYAAIEAARAGCSVFLVDRSLIGRGGATVMAQMTVAVALGSQTPDHWSHHLRRHAGSRPRPVRRASGAPAVRGRPGPHPRDGRLGHRLGAQGRPHRAGVRAPATTARAASMSTSSIPARRCRRRCAAWSQEPGHPQGRRPRVVDLVRAGDEVAGAVALHLDRRAPVTIAAKATVVATGGLTRLYRRNSASANMGGDGYALALRAGAPLVDMEFVQFFPIGHLAPRLIGMDPIMWDPFRYKLGGRLLNSAGEEFTARYGVSEDGRYVITRDLATYAIVKEVEAGRGSPHGGAYLSFQHCSEAELRARLRPGDRPARHERYRPHPNAGRGRADRALPHGRLSSPTSAWRPSCRACWSPARRSAAPTAPTGFPAMPSPRPWCSAPRPASSAAERAKRMPAQAFRPRRRAPRSISSPPAATATTSTPPP